MKEGKGLKPDIPVPGLDGIGEKTFLGWGRLSTRALLFFLFGVFAMIASIGGLYVADERLSTVHKQLEQAKALEELVVSVEKSNLRIRINEKNYLLHKNAKYIDSHKLSINLLSEVLNTLYTHPAAAPVKEHITTINEGLAQYALEFQNTVSAQIISGKSSVFSKKLVESMREIETRVAAFKTKHLKNYLAAIKGSEKDFVKSGAMKDLVKLNKDIDGFSIFLSSTKLKEEKKLLIMNLIKAYQGNLAQFAKSRLKRKREVGRLDDIFAYIAPSVNGLASFAKSNLVKMGNDERQLRKLYRITLPAGGAAILIAVMLFGLVMMRSIADPVRDVSQAAKRLAAGDENIFFPALGNKDEMGDIARALFLLKNKFFALSRNEDLARNKDMGGEDTAGDVARLNSELEAANEKVKKGEAAMAEATQLRIDLEALKSGEAAPSGLGGGDEASNEIEQLRQDLAAAHEDVMKGEAAIAEVSQLRADMDALKSQENESAQKAAQEAAQEAAKEAAQEAAKEVEQLRRELEEAKMGLAKGEAAAAEAGQLRIDMEAMKSSADDGSEAAQEITQLRFELDETKKEMAKGEAALIEAALLRIDLDSTKAELEKATDELTMLAEADDVAAASAMDLAVRSDQTSEQLGELIPQEALSGQITTASQQLAKSSQVVSAAAYEAERTGIMIKGLVEATAKVEEVAALLASIVGQTDFLAPPPGVAGEDADSSLVVLTADYKKASGQEISVSNDEDIGQRFDAIRAATNQAAWNIKDIAGIIQEVKQVASEIASNSSAEALEITNNLLEQSENLRGMLDTLVTKIQGPPQTEA